MAQIINLRQARKAHKRKADQATAAANRAKFGQTKAQRSAQAMETARVQKLVDGARLEKD